MKHKNRIIAYVMKYKWRYLLGIVTLFLVDLLNLYIPRLTGEITDGLQRHTMEMNEILTIIGYIVMIGALLTIGRFFWRFFIFGTARKIECELRNDMFEHLTTLSMNFFQEHKTGDLMAHFTNDLNAVRMTIGPAVITTFDAIIQTILVLITMVIYVDLRLTMIAVIPLIFIAIGGIYYGVTIEKRFAKKQKAFSELTDQVQESISGVRVIKAFVQERKEIASFAKANRNNKEKNLSVVKLQATVIPLLDVAVGISTVMTLVYGGYLVIMGEITLGKFVAFNQYIGMLVWPMLAAGDSITFISQGLASAKRMEHIFLQQPEIIDGQALEQEPCLRGKVEFSHVNFSYGQQEDKVLKDISFTVQPGETLAILGRTGSGKTTIANLLLRLDDISSGSIKIDDILLQSFSLKTLRKNIGYVMQDNFLFSDTLANNIAFSSDTTDIEQVIIAAKDACVHENIMEFPNQYNTLVGERGVTISGGQKQRSSIARALMKDAKILILDDALSAVDTNTEKRILRNLKKNRANKTTIIIAHRISTIANADHIVVLKHGEIAEYGTHKSLLASKGIYARMYEKQQLEEQLEEE